MKYVLFFYISTFCSVCVCVCVCVRMRAHVCTVPNMTAICISLISGFPGMLLRYCPSYFEMVPIGLLSPVSLLLSHSSFAEYPLWGLYILKSYQLLSWSHFCLQELQHLLTSTLFFIIMDYDVWFIVRNSLGRFLSVHTCWFHNMVTSPSWLVSNDFGTWSYKFCCLILPLFPCIRYSVVEHTLYQVSLLLLLLLLLLYHYYCSSCNSSRVSFRIRIRMETKVYNDTNSKRQYTLFTTPYRYLMLKYYYE